VDAQCIFCRIASGEIASKELYRDDDVVAIEDVNPQAPVHLLVMPVVHRRNVAELADESDSLTAKLFSVASNLGRERSAGNGFRLVVNTGEHGGQTVDHVHVHVLAGRPMHWPPG